MVDFPVAVSPKGVAFVEGSKVALDTDPDIVPAEISAATLSLVKLGELVAGGTKVVDATSARVVLTTYRKVEESLACPEVEVVDISLGIGVKTVLVARLLVEGGLAEAKTV